MSQQINLFNPVFLKQKKVFSAVNMVDAMAALIVGVAVFYAYASIETLNLDRQSVETARQYHQAKVRLAETSARYAPKKIDAGLAAEVNDLQARLNARKAMLDSLGIGLLRSGPVLYSPPEPGTGNARPRLRLAQHDAARGHAACGCRPAGRRAFQLPLHRVPARIQLRRSSRGGRRGSARQGGA